MRNASVFGESDRYAVLGAVHCIGTEPELLECSHSSLGQHLCGTNFYVSGFTLSDIAISCYGMNYYIFQVCYTIFHV